MPPVIEYTSRAVVLKSTVTMPSSVMVPFGSVITAEHRASARKLDESWTLDRDERALSVAGSELVAGRFVVRIDAEQSVFKNADVSLGGHVVGAGGWRGAVGSDVHLGVEVGDAVEAQRFGAVCGLGGWVVGQAVGGDAAAGHEDGDNRDDGGVAHGLLLVIDRWVVCAVGWDRSVVRWPTVARGCAPAFRALWRSVAAEEPYRVEVPGHVTDFEGRSTLRCGLRALR